MLPQASQTSSVSVNQFDRIGITGADADASALQPYACQGLSVATVSALCDTPSATITLRMFFYNSSLIPCGTSVAITFTSDATADFGQLFMGMPNADFWRPTAGASYVAVKVDSVSSGRWSIHGSVG
jgi:hypothetical protein